MKTLHVLYSGLGGASSVVFSLLKENKKKILKNNDKIILTGFGVGLSWGSVFVKWKKIN